ncbi:MAG TPA: serine/threonine-protein kinase [Gammaproteobacteria bacterium]|nr:serine/threonine-protein kinase [Gammaproteobacteria bacterium]
MCADKHRQALQAGFELLWYRIDRVLGQGAFGITYLAHDVNLDRPVAIKEYLPSQLCMREASLSVQPLSEEHRDDFQFGLQRFISEARVLTKFEHPNLIRVFNVFEANNTAYMVMNYEQGQSLHSVAKQKQHFSEKELVRIILPLMDALTVIHAQGFIHRDIKPANIFLREDGSPVLIDFGSARQTRHANPLTLTNFVSPGYAPIEQYASKSDKQGPWTDIYGFGATLYKIITGVAPTNAIDRSETLTHDGKDCYISLAAAKAGEYREQFLNAIDQALAFRAQDRPRTIDEWRTLFDFDEEDIETQPFPARKNDSATFHVNPEAATETVSLGREEPATLQQATDSATVNLFTGEGSGTVKTTPGKTPVSRSIIAAGSMGIILLAVVIYFLYPDTSPTDITTGENDSTVSAIEEPVQPQAEETPVMKQKETANNTAGDMQQQEEIARLLREADERVEQFKLTSPRDDNAYDRYLQVLAMDLENADAKAGIKRISDRYIALAYSAIERSEFDRARLYINKAEEIWPQSGKIAAANSRYNTAFNNYQAQQPQSSEDVATTPSPAPETSSKEGEGGAFSDIKNWFREKAEKSSSETREDTAGDKFTRSIGGGSN